MTTELQNKAWSVLPKEFKKEVNKIYFNAVVYHPCGYNHKTDLLKYLFGHHNLTSDAEEEEMLTVPRKKVQRAYNTSREIVKAENPDSLMYSMHTQIMYVLENIFGSKCLPDAHEDNFVSKKPQPAEPKEDKHFDNILKDSFRDHNRLHIAAILAAGMLASEVRCYPVDRALELADKLIAECEKGDNHA